MFLYFEIKENKSALLNLVHTSILELDLLCLYINAYNQYKIAKTKQRSFYGFADSFVKENIE